MSKAFGSQADLAEKKVTFEQLSKIAYAYTAEGDPNTGIVFGDEVKRYPDSRIRIAERDKEMWQSLNG